MADPVVAGNAPVRIELEADKTYFWCTCGQSAKQPFCDGAHKGSEFAPMKFKPEAAATKSMCLCKHTKNGPYCDGSHKAL